MNKMSNQKGTGLLGEAAMIQLKRGERLQIMLTEAELEAVDTWRFRVRMPSRAAAVRELLKRGLSAEGFSVAESGTHSKDFGVVDLPDGLDKEEKAV
jgi:hypothetical protein